jgi:hypothetical protein
MSLRFQVSVFSLSQISEGTKYVLTERKMSVIIIIII